MRETNRGADRQSMGRNKRSLFQKEGDKGLIICNQTVNNRSPTAFVKMWASWDEIPATQKKRGPNQEAFDLINKLMRKCQEKIYH